MFISPFRRLKNLKNLSRPLSTRRPKEKVVIPEQAVISKEWHEGMKSMMHQWKKFDRLFNWTGPDAYTKLSTPIDLSPQSIRRWARRKAEESDITNQEFIEERLATLGPDLAAAHFVVHRGGRVRFAHDGEWVAMDADGKYNLPIIQVPGMIVNAIDLKGFNIRRNGLENILHLPRLSWLSFEGTKFTDDWMIDEIASVYYDKLKYLDVSHCQRITHRFLSCLYRFEKLETLRVHGISNSPEFKHACLMLEEVKPTLNIVGVDYDGVDEAENVARIN